MLAGTAGLLSEGDTVRMGELYAQLVARLYLYDMIREYIYTIKIPIILVDSSRRRAGCLPEDIADLHEKCTSVGKGHETGERRYAMTTSI